MSVINPGDSSAAIGPNVLAQPERPTIFSQLAMLEESCLADWRDPVTGELPNGWWPEGFVVSFGDTASSCYAIEFSGHHDFTSRSYTATLSGFQMIDGTMSDLAGTVVSVSDQAEPEVRYSEEDLATTPDQDEQILIVYADMLERVLDLSQDGVRTEVRFAKVRKVTQDRLVAEPVNRTLPGVLGVLEQ